MAAVLEPLPQPDASGASNPGSTAASRASGSGLKPIQRLISDSRIDRIVPESNAATHLQYCSQFARDFIRADYNFCAAKVTVARGGKVRALDKAFRESGEWLGKALTWIEQHPTRSFPLEHEVIELKITHPLAGRLVRCLTQYDRIFVRSMEVLLAGKIQPHERETLLLNAGKRLKHIVQVCIPDNNEYLSDGTRRSA